MTKLSAYLREQLKPFDRSALWSNGIAGEGALVVFWWAVPAFILVCLVSNFQQRLPSAYLSAAIAEGIGPHLWNVVGTLGLVLVGIALLLPKSRFIAKSAYQVLINTYAIGGLSFGLLFGQFINMVAAANIERWKAWVVGAGGVFLTIQVLLLNFSLWYLGHLMASRENSDGFMHRVEKVHLRIRLIGFLFIAGLPATLLYMQK